MADVARRIRQRGIRCAIRGSGAGCLVNHLTGISAVDPLEHGLIMERFLSEGRHACPTSTWTSSRRAGSRRTG